MPVDPSTILQGVFSEYGALVGVLMFACYWLASWVKELIKERNDSRDKERDSLIAVIVENTRSNVTLDATIKDALRNRP